MDDKDNDKMGISREIFKARSGSIFVSLYAYEYSCVCIWRIEDIGAYSLFG